MAEKDHRLYYGRLFKYPTCCINEFLVRDSAPNYIFKSPFLGSGFVPCEVCHTKTVNMSREQAINWLGRDPFKKQV